MPAIVWDEAGKRFYETGVDHGVLYVADDKGGYGKGVAWNGLSSVTESPSGAEESAIYADNIKYLSLRSVEQFEGTIEAYTYPDEFGVCDGSADLATGLKIGQQSRKKFAFCYRTKKGTDTNDDAGYIIHIVYGATAAPSERQYQTVNDSPEAITFSWSITTTPVEVTGYKPTAHVEIDTSKFTADGMAEKLKKITDSLYGTADVEAAVLLPDAIAKIINGDTIVGG